MKFLLTSALMLLTITTIYAQKLKQNENTKRWEYVKVFEVKDTNPSEIYKRILTKYIPQSDIIQSKIENEKIVIRYQFRLGTFKYVKVTETFDIKQGKFRWKLSDLVYLKANTSLSKYKQLDETSDKSIIKKINKIMPDWIKGVDDKIVNVSKEENEW